MLALRRRRPSLNSRDLLYFNRLFSALYGIGVLAAWYVLYTVCYAFVWVAFSRAVVSVCMYVWS